ncbi:MAG: fibronectin type III domain-containing protein [Kiritimatiellae bacterium]|nr:fibronectin type III domain-containing protein [Kiritimatiellia bacterium]
MKRALRERAASVLLIALFTAALAKTSASEDSPPAAPSALTASGVSASEITVTWRDNSTNEDGFKIDRRESGTVTWSAFGAAANATSLNDTGLAADTSYYYRALAFNSAGDSDYTDAVSARTQPALLKPAAPRGLAAQPVSADAIGLSWTDASDNEEGFEIRRSLNGADFETLAPVFVAANVTTYTDADLAADTTYWYKIRSYNAAGSLDYTAPVSARTPRGVWGVLDVRVAASSDDAEEDLRTGGMYLNSSDLELTYDGHDQAIGMRFNNVAIPRGATIVKAYLQFKADETGSTVTVLTIRGQSADNAGTFTSAAGDITSRSATAASVAWSPAAWTGVGAAGAAQRTPDIAAIVQEIVDRSGWTRGNAMALLVSGTGKRTADSYDGDGAGAPLLHVEYTTATDTVEIRLAESDDDAEERPDGSLYLTSSDLELVYDGGGNQEVGMRFSGVAIPQGATILEAWVQFKVDEVGTASTALRIEGQASEDAAAFTAAANDISSRPRTAASVGWNPPAWNTVGEAGAAQRTPDIAAVLQEIVSRAGWAAGNPLALIVTGSGERAAESYDGDSSGAPLLHVEYATGEPPTVEFAVSASAGDEGTSTVALTLRLSHTTDVAVAVGYGATGGTAAGAGKDYMLTPGTVTFEPGETDAAIPIRIIDDGEPETDETVVVSLSDPVNVLLGAGTSHTYIVHDNDPATGAVWTAYNDLAWFAGQTARNITTYTTTNGFPSANPTGRLVDFETGLETPAVLSVRGGRGVYEDQGRHPAAGTDAFAVFDGKADGAGTVSYGDEDLVLTLSGLASDWVYEIVFYGDRNGAYYVDTNARHHYGTLEGAVSFRNESTPGAARLTHLAPDDTSFYNVGYNADAGIVTRFAQVSAGADGCVSLRLRRDRDLKYYSYANAVMVKAAKPLVDAQVFVDRNAPGPVHDGRSWSTAFVTIQEGIDAAVDGNVVLVADGTYSGVGNRDIEFRGKAVTVQSESGAEATVVDCQSLGRGFLFAAGETTNSVLCGITVCNGLTNTGAGILCSGASPAIKECVLRANVADRGISGAGLGGGIGVVGAGSAPVIEDCLLIGNTAVQRGADDHAGGGGIYLGSGSGTVRNCTVVSNTASGSMCPAGGGVLCGGGSPTITGCVVAENSVEGEYYGYGAGIYCTATPLIEQCSIISNRMAGASSPWGGGGGICCDARAEATIRYCRIEANRIESSRYTGQGGGVFCRGGSTFDDCLVRGNVVDDTGDIMASYGAAIYARVTSSRSPTFRNCVISDNGGFLCQGAMFVERGRLTFINTTVIANRAIYGGVLGGSGALTAFNSVFWDNSGEEIAVGSADVHYCCVMGGYAGEGNVDADPKLDADYHPTASSSCIDAGTDRPEVERDAAGRPRPLDGDADGLAQWDIGAYEFANPAADTDGDGESDTDEFLNGTDPLDAADPHGYQAVFTACNDLAWFAGQVSANITTYTSTNGASGLTNNGRLVHRDTGAGALAFLEVTGGGNIYEFQGAAPAPGTDAHAAFGGSVDCAGTLSYSSEDLFLRLTGLRRELRYEVVLYGDRGESRYVGTASRCHYGTLLGADSFRNASSDGVLLVSDVVPDDTALYNVGYNNPYGSVTRFLDIDAGADGEVVLRVARDVSHSYYTYANALLVRSYAPTASVPVVEFSAAAAAVEEGAALSGLEITVRNPPVLSVTVDCIVTGGTATGGGADYTYAAATYTFAPGTTRLPLQLAAVDDAFFEGDETVEVALANPSNAELGAVTNCSVTITENDPAITVQFAATALSGAEDHSPALLEVVLSEPPSVPVAVNFGVAGGTATGGGADYALSTPSLLFAPGQIGTNLVLTILDDEVHEPDETVVITILSASPVQLGANTACTCTIADDDLPSDSPFTAYNDLAWFAGQPAQNITTVTTTNGFPSGVGEGRVIDYATGEKSNVRLSVAGGSGVYASQGRHPAAGTDAFAVFDGKTDGAGTVSYGAEDLVLAFSGLRPDMWYELVLYCDRNNPAYTGSSARRHHGALLGAEHFRNQSTSGTSIESGVMPDDTTVYNAGFNNQAGYVTRYTDIVPGSDGRIELRLGRDAAATWYTYANALMLRGYAEQMESPPEPPTQLAATPLSASTIELTWRDNSANEERFAIERSLDGAEFGEPIIIPADVTRYVDSGLACGTVYHYRLRAEHRWLGNSAYTEPASAQTPAPTRFVACNVFAGVAAGNVTAYGADTNGFLVDLDSGGPLDARLQVSGGQNGSSGGNALDGTDAGDVFNGVVDCGGVLETDGTECTLSVNGLDDGLEFEFVLFGNKDIPSLAIQQTTVTISDVASYENHSTPGTDFAGPGDPSTTLITSWNRLTGYVARFRHVSPGGDGDVVLTLSGEYGVNALMVRVEPQQIEHVPRGSTWTYMKGTAEPASPVAQWRQLDFDDSAWSAGPAPFGYGDPLDVTYGTPLNDMQNSYSALFLRRRFHVPDPAAIQALALWAQYDDGFVMWINGYEVARVNVSGAPGDPLTHDGCAAGNAERLEWRASLVGSELPPLYAGLNVIAVQAFNRTLSSSDAYIDAEMILSTAAAAGPDSEGMPAAAPPPAAADADADGVPDEAEFIAGTDSGDPADYFAVDITLSDAGVVVTLPTVQATGSGYEGLARYYALEVSAGADAPWTVVSDFERIAGDGRPVIYAAPPGATGVPVYYRARVWLEE